MKEVGSTGSVLRFAGTGTAFHKDGRGSQCLLVEPRAEIPFLVDVGPTAICAMERYEWDLERVGRLFVTHLHGDHTAGWPFLLLNLGRLHRRRDAFEVCGPAGVREHLEGLASLCYGDLLTPERLGFEVHYRELEVADSRKAVAGRLRFDLVPMEHHPTSVGYRFHLEDGALAVTGDTGWCPALEELAGGSDLVVTECTSLEPIDRAHLSLREIRRNVGRLGTGRLILVHLTDEVAAALAADPIERVVAGHDGMVLPVAGPRRSTEV
jgi:ribonuclease BN (tRNA processing enzyme)